MYEEKGRPLSRAKAHIWREVAAMTVIVPTMDRMMRTVVRMTVALKDPVEL